MSAGLRDPLSGVMRAYAGEVGAEVGSLFFFFGGERIDGADTAEEVCEIFVLPHLIPLDVFFSLYLGWVSPSQPALPPQVKKANV